MIDIVSNLARVKGRIARAAAEAGRNPAEITLVAASKYADAEAVAKLVEAGHLDFGENRVQDGLRKMEMLGGKDLRWHLIGRIQTNKIKYITPFCLVHSLDRWDLAVVSNLLLPDKLTSLAPGAASATGSTAPPQIYTVSTAFSSPRAERANTGQFNRSLRGTALK